MTKQTVKFQKKLLKKSLGRKIIAVSGGKTLDNLHDRFFKRFFSEIAFAKEIFKLVLSPEEFAACDWDTLKVEKDSLKDKRADLVFTVALKGNPSAKFQFCILLEHKSSYNKHLFRQVLSYQTLLYERKSDNIIAVIPIVFYHGKEPWRWPISFQEAFFGPFFDKIPVSFRKSMLDYKLKLLDTHDPKVQKALQDPNIQSRGALALLSKIWFLKKSVPELLEFVSAFSGFSGKREDLILSAVDYLKSAGGVSVELWKKVEQLAIERSLLKRGGYMDIREEIKEVGIQEGMQKGLREGMQKGMQQVALNMLQSKFKFSVISEMTGLSEEEIKKLKNNS